MWSKHGVSIKDFLLWFICIPLTAFAAIALIYIPSAEFEDGISKQPIPLDAFIMEKRLLMKASMFSPVLGLEESQLASDLKASTSLELPEKRFAFSLSAGNQAVYGNRGLYEDAVPLASVSFDRFTSSRTFISPTGPVVVTIDQVYPKRYGKLS